MVDVAISPQTGMLGGKFMQLADLQPNQGRWDTFNIASGAALLNSYDFFVFPEGQVGSGFARPKTRRETNMEAGGKLESGINGTVKTIYVTTTPVGAAPVSSATNEFIMNFLEDSVLDVRVNDAEVVGPRTPVRYGGYGTSGFVDQTGGADVSIASTVATNRMKAYRLRKEIGIPANTGFTVSIRFNTNNTVLSGLVPAGADFRVSVYLLGTFGRIAVN